MPLSPDAWASIGTTLFNTGSTLYANSQNRKNALADWNRQNTYNAPAQQMQRYKEAGLNPNLIYSQQNNAQPVRSTDYVAPQAPDFQGILAKSSQIKVQNQQLANLELTNKAIEAQIMKTKADALYVASNTKFKDLDITRLQGQLPGLVEGVQLRNEAMKADINNKVAETNNKIANLPILERQKEKLSYEIDRLFQSNKFIEKSANAQLAIQRAMVASINVATNLNRKKVVTEDFNQEAIMSQIRNVARNAYKEQDDNVDMDWINTITNIAGTLLPYNMGKILPKFKQ
jgi:hypothetical protein